MLKKKTQDEKKSIVNDMDKTEEKKYFCSTMQDEEWGKACCRDE